MFEEDNLKITAISMIDHNLEYKGDRKKVHKSSYQFCLTSHTS